MGAELFHADGRTVMPKLMFVSRNFANAPKNETRMKIYNERKDQLMHNVTV
jgi:hypothetical protein